MFSLKFDLLFPSFAAAKAAAKRLNSSIRRPAPCADPRELHRMREELRAARDKLTRQAIDARNLFL